MWCDSSPPVPDYTLATPWPRVPYQTLPTPSEAVPEFCSVATKVQAGVRICIYETAATLRPMETRGKSHGDKMCPQ